MSIKPLRSIGLIMPVDFPSEKYDSVNDRMARFSGGSEIEKSIWAEFTAGWKAVAYRLLACKEHSDAYTLSIARAGSAPGPEQRYLQDRELYGFFVSGISVIESYFYSLYMKGALIFPNDFPFDNKTVRDVYPLDVIKTYRKVKKEYHGQLLTHGRRVLRNKICKEWNYIRNVLIHRSAPGRNLYSTNAISEWKINNISLDGDTTNARYSWLANEIGQFIAETNAVLAAFDLEASGAGTKPGPKS